MRKPIDFDSIDYHEAKYEFEKKKSKNRNLTESIELNDSQNPEEPDFSKLIPNKSRINTVRKVSRMTAKTAMEDCYEKKKKMQSQTENNKEYWKKIKSYGNRV